MIVAFKLAGPGFEPTNDGVRGSTNILKIPSEKRFLAQNRPFLPHFKIFTPQITPQNNGRAISALWNYVLKSPDDPIPPPAQRQARTGFSQKTEDAIASAQWSKVHISAEVSIAHHTYFKTFQ